MENGPFEDVFPIENGDFHCYGCNILGVTFPPLHDQGIDSHLSQTATFGGKMCQCHNDHHHGATTSSGWLWQLAG